MQALKALVTIMAVIIVIGTGAVIWGIARQASKSQPLTGTGIVAEERAPWQTLALGQPAGTKIATVTSAGDLVILHLFTETPGRDERIVVVDPNSGTLLGTIAVGASP
jgi:hypothetical protein